MREENEDVGYRRPPKATRFKAGASGNPSGRHDDQVDAMTQFMDWLERHEETDFSKPNVAQRPLGVRTREPDYGVSIPTRPPQSEGRNPPSRGLAVIAKPQLYNPPFPEVKAWVTY